MRTSSFLAIILFLLPVAVFGEQPSGVATEAKKEAKAIEKNWHKDPFAPPKGTAPSGRIAEEAPSFELSAVLFSNERSSAIVNGRVLHSGDEFEGWKILDIKRTYVIFGNGKRNFKVELKK